MKIPISSVGDYLQTRIYPPDYEIDDLIQSFLRQGQLSPILVRPHPTKSGKYQIVFGNRRLRAAAKLGWPTIDAKIVKVTNVEALIMAITENLDRKDLCDYEKALILEQLREATGKTYADVSGLIGKSPAFVSQHIAMLHVFPDETIPAQEKMRVLCALTEKHARILMRMEDPMDRWNTAKLVVGSSMGVRELEKICISPSKTRSKGGRLSQTKSIQEVIIDSLCSLNRKDMTRYSEHADWKHFTLFSVFPPYYKLDGKEALNHIYHLLQGIDRFEITIHDMDVHRSGNFAYVAVTATHKVLASERSVMTDSRGTVVLKKEGNSWKILHMHWSGASPADVANLTGMPRKRLEITV